MRHASTTGNKRHKLRAVPSKRPLQQPLPPPPAFYAVVDVACVQTKKSLSGTKFRKMLRGGDEIPEWFAFKSVVDVLRAAN